ncbi:hypothetical protein C8R45DRAFT_122779 [Mycena sanguinolenta]|nr:hypothetical protein C8R45DRAFT_122779 [Mycena sanguinolenta]
MPIIPKNPTRYRTVVHQGDTPPRAQTEEPKNVNARQAPNEANVRAQAPIYVLEGRPSEVFSSPSAYEYAYAAVSPSMKSLLQAVTDERGCFGIPGSALRGSRGPEM